VQVFAAPIEASLKDFMEFGETGFADHEQSSPNQRTHAAEKDTKLVINPDSGCYGTLGLARFLEISVQRLEQIIRTRSFCDAIATTVKMIIFCIIRRENNTHKKPARSSKILSIKSDLGFKMYY
jgi:hypothetical protein